MKELFEGIYLIGNRFATKNLVPGKKVYGEKLLSEKGIEFREWIPQRSKIAAAIKKGLKKSPFRKGSKILYLGSSEGTTVSHLSDIVGEKGIIFGVDIGAKVMRKFVLLCRERKNLFPLLFSASQPEKYKEFIQEKVDVLVQDVSQKNQSDIFLKNADLYLKKDGIGIYSIKARSIDVTKNPKKVFEEEKKKLVNAFDLIEFFPLDPFEKDHAMFIGRKK